VVVLAAVAALGCATGVSENPHAVGQYSFGTPSNLGMEINSAAPDGSPCISADGLELYFHSGRPGGAGGMDLWMATRSSVDAPWRAPVNLGPTVNSPANEIAPSISSDGLELYFSDYVSYRPGGVGSDDLWVARRASTSATWETPVWLGAAING